MIEFERYATQARRWPASGRVILAQFDKTSVVVYQAYRRSIADWAVKHQKLGGPEFSFSRMTWIKPNFLWMMYRSGWGTKQDQEGTLALRISRVGFDEILREAVPSSFDRERYVDSAEWESAVARSDVRLQWDPDHGPRGEALERRAIQLGLRGRMLERFCAEMILSIEDVSKGVATQRGRGENLLETPREDVYPTESASS